VSKAQGIDNPSVSVFVDKVCLENGVKINIIKKLYNIGKCNSTVVKHSPQCPRVKGLSLAVAIGTGMIKMANNKYYF
jgi:hypothetical protein